MPPARIRPNSDILTHGPGYDLHQLYLDLAGELPSSPNSERRGSVPHNVHPSAQAESRSSGSYNRRRDILPLSPIPQPSSSYTFPPAGHTTVKPSNVSPSNSLFLPETPTSSNSHRLPNVTRPLVINTPNLNGEGPNPFLPWYRRHLGWVLTLAALFGSMAFMAVILTVFFTTDKNHGGIARRSFEQPSYQPMTDVPEASEPVAPQVTTLFNWSKRLWSPGLPAVVDDGRNRRRFTGG